MGICLQKTKSRKVTKNGVKYSHQNNTGSLGKKALNELTVPNYATFSNRANMCVCCDTPLFDSDEKFQSSSGWPSFTQPIKENAIAYYKDRGFGMYRIETVCNT